MKQHELIAVEGDVKKQVKRQQTDLYHLLQKGELFFGMEKEYSPMDEEGEKLPSESKVIQRDVSEILQEFGEATVRWIDTMASKDAGNQQAKADLIVDGETLAEGVPVLTLLGLEQKWKMSV